MSNSDKFSLEKFEDKTYYYRDKVEKIQEELKKKSQKSKYGKIFSYLDLIEFIH